MLNKVLYILVNIMVLTYHLLKVMTTKTYAKGLLMIGELGMLQNRH